MMSPNDKCRSIVITESIDYLVFARGLSIAVYFHTIHDLRGPRGIERRHADAGGFKVYLVGCVWMPA